MLVTSHHHLAGSGPVGWLNVAFRQDRGDDNDIVHLINPATLRIFIKIDVLPLSPQSKKLIPYIPLVDYRGNMPLETI